MSGTKSILAVLILVSMFSSLFAATPQNDSVLPPDVERYRTSGFENLYNMDYVHAKENFVAMTRTEPSHPAGYIYLAGAIWLEHLASLRRLQTQLYNRNDAFFTGSGDILDPSVDKSFHTLISKGMELAQQQLKKNGCDLSGLYYTGVANGTLAGYETTVERSFFRSLKHGSRAVEFHRQVLKQNPNFIDAQLSVGMFDYVVGSLPLAVKILAFLGGVHGSKKDGLKAIDRVHREGHYARDEAAAILVLLYDREKRPQDSLRLLQELTRRYLRNFIFRVELGRNFALMKKFNESFAVFEELTSNQAAMQYMPDLIHYQYAQALFDAAQYEKAREHFIAASYSSKAPPSLVSMANLEAAKCLDASGKRKMAEAQYQYVLKLPDVFHSHDQAKKYLKEPFVP